MSISPNSKKIYLSYAYVDNQDFVDNGRGWVSAFKDDLETEISFLIGQILPITIFHDKQFESPNLLTVKYIRNTDIFISIGTPAYFLSDFCQKELNLFLKREDFEPSQQLFLVDKKPFEDMAFQSSFPLQNSFLFYDEKNELEWSRKNSREKYFNQIQKLAQQIHLVLQGK